MHWIVSAAWESLGQVVSPSACAACDGDVPLRQAFCASCAVTAEPFGETLEDGGAAFVYAGAIATAVQRMKFGANGSARWDVARPLGLLMATTLSEAFRHEAIDRVCAVPSCARRLRERGFNPSGLLASALARAWKLDVSFDDLTRVRDTPAQSRSSRQERLVQLDGAFAARHVSGARILVVDDVRTTGATIAECTRALRDAGAARVSFAALAQTP